MKVSPKNGVNHQVPTNPIPSFHIKPISSGGNTPGLNNL